MTDTVLSAYFKAAPVVTKEARSGGSPIPKTVEAFGISLAALRLKDFPPVSYVVADVLPEGCTILGGRPKLGKSWLALDIGIGVARGGYVLGDKQCVEGDVLYLALEDNERRLQSRTRKMLAEGEWPSRLALATTWPRANEGGLDKIRRWAKSVARPRLVIVDVLTAFRAHPAPNEKKSTYATDYEAVAGLRDLGNQLGIAILIVTHVRKGESEDPVEAISGTLGLAGAADTLMVLNRKAETGVTLYGRGRDIEEFDVALEWLADCCRWKIKGATVEVKRSDERTQILDALGEAGEPLTAGEIAIETGMKGANVRKMLSRMVRDGEVAKAGRGRYVTGGEDPTAGHNGHKVTNEDDEEYDEDEEGGNPPFPPPSPAADIVTADVTDVVTASSDVTADVTDVVTASSDVTADVTGVAAVVDISAAARAAYLREIRDQEGDG